MVEMSEAAEILRYATKRSLVILDEVGRGTSTTDGLAIAASIMDALTERIGCFTMFATHYHELVPMMEEHANIVPMQTQVIEKADGIVFTHRLVPGASASSFGIEVAKLAGIPGFVIEKAKAYLEQSESKIAADVSALTPAAADSSATERVGAVTRGAEKPLSRVQQGLFGLPETKWADEPSEMGESHGDLNRLIAKLEGVKIHKTTPLQALNILNELKSMLVPVQHRSLFDEDSTRTL
jgi:DNA mismatch repair protein MutS